MIPEVEDVKLDGESPPKMDEPPKDVRPGKVRRPRGTDRTDTTLAKPLSPTNVKLARAATDTLLGINSFAALGLRIGQLPITADALEAEEQTFQTRVYEALLLDPELCQIILRGGGLTGRMALLLAYLMLAKNVAPVATMEIANRRLERAERREASAE